MTCQETITQLSPNSSVARNSDPVETHRFMGDPGRVARAYTPNIDCLEEKASLSTNFELQYLGEPAARLPRPSDSREATIVIHVTSPYPLNVIHPIHP